MLVCMMDRSAIFIGGSDCLLLIDGLVLLRWGCTTTLDSYHNIYEVILVVTKLTDTKVLILSHTYEHFILILAVDCCDAPS